MAAFMARPHFLDFPPTDLSQLRSTQNAFSPHLLQELAQNDGGARPDITSLAGADYGVDVRTGFLPSEEPLSRLSDIFEIWETALDIARAEIASGNAQPWREAVAAMPVIATHPLITLPELRRAHLVLTFLQHFYIHATTPSDYHIPPSISEPLLAVSRRLNMPPILTYSDTVLYNWRFIQPHLGYRPDNIVTTTSFTGTPSENHFYMTSLLIELAGNAALRLMATMQDEAFMGDAKALRYITSSLKQLAVIIDDLSRIMADVRKACIPSVFYHKIRPYFNGGELHFHKASGQVDVQNLGGPSAGQSSLVHSLDLFLGIDHAPRAAASNTPFSNETFMQRMAAYMPHHHRLFIEQLARSSLVTEETSIRRLTLDASAPSELRKSYDQAVNALKRFRDAHFSVVRTYIIQPSRTHQEEEEVEENSYALRGTGGTQLVQFLKLCKDRTVEALVGQIEAVSV